MKVGEDDQVVAVARSSAASMAALESVELPIDAEISAAIESEEITEQVNNDGDEA
jgi:hypothetical protein